MQCILDFNWTITIIMLNCVITTVPVKRLEKIILFYVKAHQACICLIKNTVKIVK